MFPKSIKWRLQLWYGLILVIVLAGFGFTAYQLEHGRQFRRIDDELKAQPSIHLPACFLHHRRTRSGQISPVSRLSTVHPLMIITTTGRRKKGRRWIE